MFVIESVLKMYYFTFLLFLFGITADEDLISNVTIVWEEKSQYSKYNTSILFYGQPFKFFVEKRLYDKDHYFIKCSNENKKVIIDEPLIYDGVQYVAKVNKTKQIMANTWNCNITHKFTGLNVSFNVFAHIRLMKIPGEIRVNDRNIVLFTTNLSVSDYDAVGTYSYLYGELAKFTCQRKYGTIFHFQIFSLNISGATHETTTSSSDVNLYLKLGYNSTPNYIDCIVKKYAKQDKNIIRLILKPLTDKIEYPQFQVNGLRLTPSLSDFDHNYTFVYEYYSGEDLFVLSKLDTNKNTAISCTSRDLPNVLDPIEMPELRLNISTHQFVHQQASVDCLVKVAKKYDTSIVKDVRISLKFIEDSMKFSPSITGIQWTKIIAKFYEKVDSWTAVGTFFASYNRNDNMTLYCSSNTTGVKWNYGAEVNSSLLTATTETTNNYISSRTFQLTENVNQSILECKHDSETSKVVLIQQNEQITQTIQENDSDNNNDVSPDNSNSNNQIADESRLFSSHNFLHIIIGVISIIIILLIITLFACICKRKKISNTDTDVNYENLPAHNEGSMPIPSQWDTNRFKNENIEDAYAKVIPKSQRTKLIEIYSDPLSNMENSCYATPYNANSESSYAEITLKSQRNGNVPSETANEDNYAQIVPKGLKNVAKDQVLQTNYNHAENGTKIRNRVDTDKHKYANIFNSEVYANVNSKTET